MPLTTTKVIVSIAFLYLAHSTLADHQSCPDDRPYARGHNACDSCPWEETLKKYKAGELSTTRSSTVFRHNIRVSVVCDRNRPIDVDDVFEKIAEVEQFVFDLFDEIINIEDGINNTLEVIAGICDYNGGLSGGGIDDCNMYEVCRLAGVGGGCNSLPTGKAFFNRGNNATHTAFIPWLPENEWWWSRENRYGNLQHEFTHLLDYTYFRRDNKRGADSNWWVEGLAQFVQWRTLENDMVSWRRGNDRATMLDVFMHRGNSSDYYDGMRMFSFMAQVAPWMLKAIADNMRSGIYRSADSHLSWQKLLGYMASRYQDVHSQYVKEVSRVSAETSTVDEGNTTPD